MFNANDLISLTNTLNDSGTPDFFIFNDSNKLVYRGQLDDSRPGNNIEVTGTDVRNALNALINLQEINPIQKPSIGCNIKWIN